jgi:hypothetical protein
MMEADWEQNEDAGYGKYDNDEEDWIYYENPCDVCEGSSYITYINIDIENYYNITNIYNDLDYEEDEDECERRKRMRLQIRLDRRHKRLLKM